MQHVTRITQQDGKEILGASGHSPARDLGDGPQVVH